MSRSLRVWVYVRLFFPRNAAATIADGRTRTSRRGRLYFSGRARASLSSLSRSWLVIPRVVPSVLRASIRRDAMRFASRRIAPEPRVRNRWKCPEWLHLRGGHRTQVCVQRNLPSVFMSALNDPADDTRTRMHRHAASRLRLLRHVVSCHVERTTTQLSLASLIDPSKTCSSPSYRWANLPKEKLKLGSTDNKINFNLGSIYSLSCNARFY